MNGTLLQNRPLKVNLYCDRDKEFLDNISAESASEDDQEAHSDKDKENGKQEPNKDSKPLKPRGTPKKVHDKPRRNPNNLIEIKPDELISNLAKLGSLEKKNSLKKRGNNLSSSLITISPTAPLPADHSVQQNEPVTGGQPTVNAKRQRGRYFAQSINPELDSFKPKANKIQKKTVPTKHKFNLADFRKFFNQKLSQKNGQQSTTDASKPLSTLSSSAPFASSAVSELPVSKPGDQQFTTFQFKKPNDLGLFRKNGQHLKKKNQQTTKTPKESKSSTGQNPQPNGKLLHFPQFCPESSASTNSTTSNTFINPFQPNSKDTPFASTPFAPGSPFERGTVNPFRKDYRIHRNESKKQSESIDKNPFKFVAQPVKAFGFIGSDPFPLNKPLASEPERKETKNPVLVVLDNSPQPLPRTYMNTTLFSETDLDDRLNKSIELITLD